MASFEIPLVPSQPQSFLIALPGGSFRFTLQWREVGLQGWILDISDQLGNPLVAGVPLVTGAALLSQYAAIALGGDLLVASDGQPDATPTFDNLGVTSHLYFATSS